MRIHFHAKPYICPYAVYKQAQNTWEPCLYAAARQDDLTKHCIGTGVCHLKEFSSKDEKDYKKYGFPVPAKIMNGKKEKMFKLRDGNVKLREPPYREYVNQSADFMYSAFKKKWSGSENWSFLGFWKNSFFGRKFHSKNPKVDQFSDPDQIF